MNKNRKLVSSAEALRGILLNFLCYGFIFSFIFLFFMIIILFINQNISEQNKLIFNCIISLLSAIIIYLITHLTCKLSFHDFFYKNKIENDATKLISKRLNFFYILCILFFTILIITSLYVSFSNKLTHIEISYLNNLADLKGSSNALEIANSYKSDLLNNFNLHKLQTICFGIIIEIGFFYSFISLIPYQKDLFKIYNSEPKH